MYLRADINSLTYALFLLEFIITSCLHRSVSLVFACQDADKSLAWPGREQARKHVRDARDFNNMETRSVIKFFFSLQGKSPKEIHAILTETSAYFLPGRAKDLSAPLYSTNFGACTVNNCNVGFCSDQSRKRGLHDEENAWRHHLMLV